MALEVMTIGLMIFLVLLAMLILRNLFAWYSKRNEQIENQQILIEQNKEIIKYLKIISEK